MMDFDIDLKQALTKLDMPRIDHLRRRGLDKLERWPRSLPVEVMFLLVRACVECQDRQGLAKLADQLPHGSTPELSNYSLREAAYLDMALGYAYREQKEVLKARHRFESAFQLAGRFRDESLQVEARLCLQTLPPAAVSNGRTNGGHP